jgi:hypothetical protein
LLIFTPAGRSNTVLHIGTEKGTLEDGGGVGKLIQGQEQAIRDGFFEAIGTRVFF